MAKPKDPIDVLIRVTDTERLRTDLVELLSEAPFSRFQEWSESLLGIAEYVNDSVSAIEEWSYAETRDEKADAKERALEALNELIAAWTNSPLDVSTLHDFEYEEA